MSNADPQENAETPEKVGPVDGANPGEEQNFVERSREEYHLYITHAALIRAKQAAGANGVAVYAGLCALAPIGGGAYKASANNIAGVVGLSARQVQRVIPILKRAKVFAMKSGKGSGIVDAIEANTYLLLRVNLSIAEGGNPEPRATHATGRRKTMRQADVPLATDSRKPLRQEGGGLLAVNRDISPDREREISPATDGGRSASGDAASLTGDGKGKSKKDQSTKKPRYLNPPARPDTPEERERMRQIVEQLTRSQAKPTPLPTNATGSPATTKERTPEEIEAFKARMREKAKDDEDKRLANQAALVGYNLAPKAAQLAAPPVQPAEPIKLKAPGPAPTLPPGQFNPPAAPVQPVQPEVEDVFAK